MKSITSPDLRLVKYTSLALDASGNPVVSYAVTHLPPRLQVLHCGHVDCAGKGVGDVNCDGFINSEDAALVLQYHVGLLTLLGCSNAADANQDRVIDSRDAALILQLSAYIIGALPV